MSRLFLYTDLSLLSPYNFATIYANRSLLSEHGIKLGPLNDAGMNDHILSHSGLWSFVPDNVPLPPDRVKRWELVQQQLDAGWDVLLMTYTPALYCHQFITRLIQCRIDLTRHETRTIFAVGSPVCLLEQWWREVTSPPPDEIRRAVVQMYMTLSRIIEHAHKEWGEANVTLLPDLSNNPVAAQNDGLIRNVFAALRCPQPLAPVPLPSHGLFLASHEARRLRLREVWEIRKNAWPKLDEKQFMDCLCMVDRDWGTAPVSPREFRQMLLQEGAEDQQRLEHLLALPQGSLDCPEWLAMQPEADAFAPLSPDKLDILAAALPDCVRNPLRQRYANDAHLLTEDQQALYTALTALNPTAIGEPVPPVELTVLTMVYNHEAYIGECMDSVLAQRTTFPVRHIVLDHHSTDGTADIVAAYAARHPSIQPVLLSERCWGENVMELFLRCRTTYAALCDGDDYFADPLKLQKQVEFLEAHSQCALCFHPVTIVLENGERLGTYPNLSELPRGVRDEYYLTDLLRCNMIQTNSVVYRWRFKECIPEWFDPYLCPGDWYWHLLHAETGKIGFLPQLMSVYRRHKTALYSTGFIDEVEHRRIHGMAELNVYQKVNNHFQGRYFSYFANLATGVFVNFIKIYKEKGDNSLLDQATREYPEFARHFLSSIKKVRVARMDVGG